MANSTSRHKKILEAVYNAIDEVNLQLPKERQIDKSPETVLVGESSNLDSQGLISLIVAVEEEVEKAFDVTINLTGDEDVISEKDSPLHTITLLTHFISRLLGAE